MGPINNSNPLAYIAGVLKISNYLTLDVKLNNLIIVKDINEENPDLGYLVGG